MSSSDDVLQGLTASCSNCGEAFDPSKAGLHLTTKRLLVAAICGQCCRGVRVAKIIVRKPDIGGYAYEQWLPTEVVGDATD